MKYDIVYLVMIKMIFPIILTTYSSPNQGWGQLHLCVVGFTALTNCLQRLNLKSVSTVTWPKPNDCCNQSSQLTTALYLKKDNSHIYIITTVLQVDYRCWIVGQLLVS